MSVLSLLLNLLWIVFGGLWMAIGWLIAAVIMAITVIGIPWARAAFNIASYTMLPFGRKAVSRAEHLGTQDIGTGLLGFAAVRKIRRRTSFRGPGEEDTEAEALVSLEQGLRDRLVALAEDRTDKRVLLRAVRLAGGTETHL